MPETTDTSLYIGLISGTSMDGVDCALVSVDGALGVPCLRASYSHRMPDELTEALLRAAARPDLRYTEWCELDTAVGAEFAIAANALLSREQVQPDRIRALGSHGQTLFHQPDGRHPNSLQIGNPNVITARTGIATVADLRRRDMADGGQGAPLLPALHQRLFADAYRSRGILNLGGIANLTVLPAATEAPTAGFDTGPANTLLDRWCELHTGSPFDAGGQYAAQGEVLPELLSTLMAEPYLARAAPKSTGTEYFNLQWLRTLSPDIERYEPADVQRTLTRFTAASVSEAAARYPLDEMWVVGGGRHNRLLVQDLEDRSGLAIRDPASLGVDGDNLEAMAFAWFAHCHLEGIAIMPTGLTGARRSCVLGALYPAG
ncbi:MAG: anhydro-N-acetylmuramic acid kinase [Pseudomonadota bacterium]